MKKILLSALLFSSFGAFSQNVNIPDANFKAYLVGNAAINTSGDSEIQVSEASAFSGVIACSNLSISDLTGIEAFPQIIGLNCQQNQLTSINLSANTLLTNVDVENNVLTSLNLSANTVLAYLDCRNNYITSLDLSTNTALQYLTFFANNLTSIDLSANQNLNELECGYNALTTLNLGQVPGIEYVKCYGNSLTSLDLSANTALKRLDCSDNGITSLDISVNTALEQFYCNYNSLTYLNLANGNNSNMTYMYAEENANLMCINHDSGFDPTTNSNWIKDATANWSDNCGPAPCIVTIPDANFKAYLLGNSLINTNGNTEIECAEATAFTGTINANNLSISDLTGIDYFTNLTELYCVSNSIISLDLSSNTALVHLQCVGNNLTSLDLSANTNLTELYCSANQLSSLDLSSNTALTLIGCHNNQLTDLDFSSNIALVGLECHANLLTSLNIANGNNANMYVVDAKFNPNLTCIEHDAGYTIDPVVNDWMKDATANWSDNCGVTSGLHGGTIQNLEFYPNPTSGILNINSDIIIKALTVYSLAGQKVMEFNNVNTIDISNLPNGVYTVRILTDENSSIIKRLIKN